MTHIFNRLLIAGSAVMMTAPSLYAQGTPERGAELVAQGDGSGAPCAACHGADGAGNSAAGFPRVAGLSAGYLEKQMRDYNSGERTSAVMQPNVDNFTEQQIQDIAAYYASLPVPETNATVTAPADQLALGEKLANLGDWDNDIPPCSSCHGPNNGGVGAVFPALAGQHPSYLSQQLQAWQEGSRKNDPIQLMTAVAERLSPEQIAAVAAYLGSLPADAN